MDDHDSEHAHTEGRAAAGTDPRGILTFDAPLPPPLENRENSTQNADFTRRLYHPRGFTRKAIRSNEICCRTWVLSYQTGSKPSFRFPAAALAGDARPAPRNTTGGTRTVTTPQPEEQPTDADEVETVETLDQARKLRSENRSLRNGWPLLRRKSAAMRRARVPDNAPISRRQPLLFWSKAATSGALIPILSRASSMRNSARFPTIVWSKRRRRWRPKSRIWRDRRTRRRRLIGHWRV